jgi:hypothetical protein
MGNKRYLKDTGVRAGIGFRIGSSDCSCDHGNLVNTVMNLMVP